MKFKSQKTKRHQIHGNILKNKSEYKNTKNLNITKLQKHLKIAAKTQKVKIQRLKME